MHLSVASLFVGEADRPQTKRPWNAPASPLLHAFRTLARVLKIVLGLTLRGWSMNRTRCARGVPFLSDARTTARPTASDDRTGNNTSMQQTRCIAVAPNWLSTRTASLLQQKDCSGSVSGQGVRALQGVESAHTCTCHAHMRTCAAAHRHNAPPVPDRSVVSCCVRGRLFWLPDGSLCLSAVCPPPVTSARLLLGLASLRPPRRRLHLARLGEHKNLKHEEYVQAAPDNGPLRETHQRHSDAMTVRQRQYTMHYVSYARECRI